MMKVGLQLYSIRDEMEQDMEKTLQAVKDMGYDYVEFAGFFGKSAEQIKNMLQQTGLKAVSVHQGYESLLNNEENIIEYLEQIGFSYAAVPYLAKEFHKGSPDFEKTVKNMKEISKRLNAHGIKLLYHNHEFEFFQYENRFLLDWLCGETGLEYINPEIDVCWVKYAGFDPAAYISRYQGHLPVVHLKDFVGSTGLDKTQEENGFAFRPVGSGCQDWEAILNAAEEAGTQYLIVEQDDNYEESSLENARKSREYLKKIGY